MFGIASPAGIDLFKEKKQLKVIITEKPRLESVDILRGVVMVLMALDHVREYFMNTGYNPLDLSQTNGFLFMTRWITHFCAPIFIFLAGTGAFLSLTRGKTKPELAKYLLSRGAWLILLELTIIRFGWVFNFDYGFNFVQVIWAIGWSMIVLAGLIFLSVKTVAAVGAALILFHNAFDGITPEQFGGLDWLWMILHVQGTFYPADGFGVFVLYPLIPWIGVMAVGYTFGFFFQKSEQERKKIFIRLGAGLILAFFVIRAINIYGDPDPWSVQDSFGKTILSFIDVEKYPPSMLYLFITLGTAILSLAYIDALKGWFRKMFLVFGKVPMFYYLLHIPLTHALAVITAVLIGISPAAFFSNDWVFPQAWGFDLIVTYFIWAAVILMLYPVCKWFASVKRRRKDWWLGYL